MCKKVSTLTITAHCYKSPDIIGHIVQEKHLSKFTFLQKLKSGEKKLIFFIGKLVIYFSKNKLLLDNTVLKDFPN